MSHPGLDEGRQGGSSFPQQTCVSVTDFGTPELDEHQSYQRTPGALSQCASSSRLGRTVQRECYCVVATF